MIGVLPAFCGQPLDRADYLRVDPAALAQWSGLQPAVVDVDACALHNAWLSCAAMRCC